MVESMVYILVYLRTTALRRKWARYYTRFPSLFTGKIAEGALLMKNCGPSMSLILSEWTKEKGNIEVSIVEPVRIDDLEEDPEVKEMASWVKRQENKMKLLTGEIPEEKVLMYQQLARKRFSVTLNLR
jgi:hypothetical protein